MTVNPNFYQAERAALEILENYNIKEPPVVPNKILTDEKIALKEESNISDDYGVISGYIELKGNSKTIVVNKDDIITRKLFTVCHELGHYFLHRELVTSKEYKKFYRNSLNNGDYKEKEANCFAINLLAPKFMLDQYEYVIKYERAYSLHKLANIFKVSNTTMSYRLKNLYG